MISSKPIFISDLFIIYFIRYSKKLLRTEGFFVTILAAKPDLTQNQALCGLH